ncbi:MAG TPA: ABC transporter substrate-binding protein [Kofleriaceae bacterium]|jgi:ABC-type transport system substrate-binding protein
MLIRRPQVRLLAGWAIAFRRNLILLPVVIGLAAACDSPARVKPWRHAPDPTAEAAAEPSSPVLADPDNTAEVRANHSHTLRIHLDAEPGRLNPLIAPTVWGRRIVMGTIFEPLIRYLPPEPGQMAGRYAPRLARSWRVSANEIRIELEPGVTFSDGRPLTSSDVQFTLDRVRDGRSNVDLRPMLEDVNTVELVTAHEVRITLKRPSGYVLRALAEIPIMSMAVYEGSLLAGGTIVGSGPYKLVSTKGGIVHLTRNEKYWGPKPAIADIEYVYQPDAAIALKDAKRGDLDIVPALIPAHWPEQASAPGIASSFTALDLSPPRWRYLAFNASKPPLDDPQVRHALGLLIDRRNIAKRVFDGLARPAVWPIWRGGFASGPEGAIPEFDPLAAGKLLDAAGWGDSDKDGIRDKDGQKLRITMLGLEKPPPKDASAPPVKTSRDFFVEAARKMGVVIDVKTAGDAFLEKKIAEGEWDLVERQYSGMVDMSLDDLIGQRLTTRGPAPRIDRALDGLAAAWDPAQRAQIATELAAALEEQWPLAGIVAEAPQGLVHKRVQGVHVWDGWLDVTQLSFAPESPAQTP